MEQVPEGLLDQQAHVDDDDDEHADGDQHQEGGGAQEVRHQRV